MKNSLLVSILVVAALPLHAFVKRSAADVERGDRVAVLSVSDRSLDRGERMARRLLSGYLRDELRRSGFESEVLEMTADDLRQGTRARRHPADFYLEVSYADADGGSLGGGGGGGVVGNVGVGAGVEVVSTEMSVEVRLYDAAMSLRDSFRLSSHYTGPQLSSVSVAYHWFYLWLPLPRSSPFRSVARDLARKAVLHLRGEEPPVREASGRGK